MQHPHTLLTSYSCSLNTLFMLLTARAYTSTDTCYDLHSKFCITFASCIFIAYIIIFDFLPVCPTSVYGPPFEKAGVWFSPTLVLSRRTACGFEIWDYSVDCVFDLILVDFPFSSSPLWFVCRLVFVFGHCLVIFDSDSCLSPVVWLPQWI